MANLSSKSGGGCACGKCVVHELAEMVWKHRAEHWKNCAEILAREAIAAERRLEEHARAQGKRLLTLDTRTGDSAQLLYTSLGYEAAGVIPGYCRAPDEDRLDATTYMYKPL